MLCAVGSSATSGSRVAGEEADRRSPGRDQPVELGSRRRDRQLRRCAGAEQRAASLLIKAPVVAADRDGQQVVLVEGGRDIRKGCVLGSDVEELVDLIGKAERTSGRNRQAVRVGSTPREGLRHRPANREIRYGRVKDVRQRIDIVGAARKAAGGVNLGGYRVDPEDLEEIAVVGVAVPEGHDAIHALRLGRRGEGQGAGGKQRGGGQTTDAHDGSSPVAASERTAFQEVDYCQGAATQTSDAKATAYATERAKFR